MPFIVASMYQFIHIEHYQAFLQPLLKKMHEYQIKGTYLLASEGINGTVCGRRAEMNHFIAWLKEELKLDQLIYKEALSKKQAFYRTKVKLKKEIVTLGVDSLEMEDQSSHYIDSLHWNAFISKPDVTLIDVRNKYEVKIGTFEKAINPETETFREFPAYIEKTLQAQKKDKIALFCTGGIRCEKAARYLIHKGFQNVYQLKGGILQYLQDVPSSDSLWKGDCFVFDQRVAVDHQLTSGKYDQCYACRMPLSAEDQKSIHYKKGVSCLYCYKSSSDKQKERFSEREKQMELAKTRGYLHIGDRTSIMHAQLPYKKSQNK